MPFTRLSLLAGAVGAVAAFTCSAHASTLISFETPVPNGGYEYNNTSPFPGPNGNFSSPTAEGVTFGGMSGIQANGSAFGFTNAPDGVQTAFLQSYSGFPASPGFITFSITGLSVTNPNYQLVFDVEGRPSTGGLPFTVLANGNPTILGAPSTASWTQEIVPFTAIAGVANFTIAINIPLVVTDNSIGLDNISFAAATPLPAALPLFAGGLGMIGLLARRWKRKALPRTA